LRQVFNDTAAEVLWLIIGAPEEREFLQDSKSQMDLSLIYAEQFQWLKHTLENSRARLRLSSFITWSAARTTKAAAVWRPHPSTDGGQANCVLLRRRLLSSSAMPFRPLGLSANIVQAVQDAGYTEPTPIQSAAIPPIIAGHDLIGIAQTGTGKTAAFTLPILTKLAAQPPGQRRGTRVLVIAPTRELVVQIEENVKAYAKHLPLTVATVFGGGGNSRRSARCVREPISSSRVRGGCWI
jgi:ATP-dependent helicase YprA (DUF1998 family)